MGSSVFIARVFAIFYLAASAGILLNREYYWKFMDDYCKNRALIFFTGMFALIVGAVIIQVHNIWVANWIVIITIIGWLGLLKGIWIIVFPGTVAKFMQAYQKNKGLIIVHGVGALIFGLVLAYLGFFVK